MTRVGMGSDPLVLTGVEKQFGGLRPLRVRELRVAAGREAMTVAQNLALSFDLEIDPVPAPVLLDPSMLVLEHPTANLAQDEAKEFAGVVRSVTETRSPTTVGLLMDEKFAKATGGRLLLWQPATGEMHERSALRFW